MYTFLSDKNIWDDFRRNKIEQKYLITLSNEISKIHIESNLQRWGSYWDKL